VGGNWVDWHGTADAIANDASVIGYWIGFNEYWNNWHASGTAPNFTLSSSPSTVKVLPGRTGSSTITVSTNDSHDSAVPGIGPIYFFVSSSSTSDMSTVSPSSISPHANQTSTATLNISVGLTQLTSYTIDVEACGYVCHDTFVTVNTVL
jgi:hypothetical protein